MNQTKPNFYTVVLLLCAGISVALYLLYSKYGGQGLVCNFSSCNAVSSSPYAYILGLPISLYGLLYYLGFIAIYFLQNDLKKVFYYSLIGVLFTAYFSSIEAFVLKAWCEWCIYTAIVCWLLCAVSFWSMKIGNADKPVVSE